MSSSTFDKFYTRKDLKFSLQTLKIFCVFVSFFWLLSTSISGQTKCFNEDETKKITDSISNPKKVGEIKNIKSELLKIDSNRKSLEDNILKEKNKDELIAKRRQLLREGIQRLCTIFKENGWLKKDLLGQDGFSAEMDLIFNVDLPNIQREFLPILISAADKGEVKRADIATLVDSIRITSGLPQLFGTYLTFSDGIVYLYPLENEKMVDEWRKSYELPSLNSFMREIETKYQTLVIKRNSPKRNQVSRKVDTKVLGLEEDDDTIKISTKLVNVKIRVIGKDANPIQNTTFAAKDFILSEDDKTQEISFFEKNKEPVDYYLILDLSGSTARIRETIWKTVGILAKLLRTGDRITVLTHFDGNLRTLLDLTPDQSNITETVSQFRGLGSSSVWDALNDTFDLIEKRNFKDRGAAMILISDAIEADSKLAFGNLLNRIKENEIMIFPIQLPTDYLIEDPFASQKRLKIAGRAFQLLAEESGGEYFNIKKDNELLAIPEKIINGLGEIFSLGFEPNGDFDGSWRQLKVKITNQNDFRVRAKTGYYAKP
ncbi:MAG: VWA domain-containing protein [Acidobacteriota bacterium]